MNPSERIKAALSRPEATRHRSPTLERPADVETTLPLLGTSDGARITPGQASAVDSPVKVEIAPSSRPAAKFLYARRVYLALAGLVLIAVSAVIIIRQRVWTGSKPAAPPPNLQVVVKTEGKGLLSVRWNAQSAPITRAREGHLVVLEANQQPKVVQLRPEELKIGHVYYESSADRLEFRLEVVDTSGAVVSDSVLALLGTAAAAPASAPAAVPPQTAPVQSPAAKQQLATNTDPSAGRNLAVAPATVPPAVATPVVPQQIQTAPRTFIPPPTTPIQRPIEETRAVVLDPTAPLPGTLAAPARVNLPQLSVVPGPSAKASSVNRPVNTGGTVQPATLLKKVSPIYPAIAKTARIQGTVRFTATIDKNGNVQNIQFVNGPQMLVQAAFDAVKKWVYRPMMLNGQPTEVITQIEVKFAIGQ